MKRLAPLFLVVATVWFAFASMAFGAPPAAGAKGDRSPGAPIATAVSTATGIAISPLLGTSAYGAYRWATAKDDAARAALPWYAQVKFWLPALLIVAACAAKDTLGAALPPGAKKPLDVLETIENKISGLVAAGAVVPATMDLFSKLLLEQTGAHSAGAMVAGTGGLAMIPVASLHASWLLDVLMVPFGVAIFAIVWMASHAINVLILLSPWGAIDAALKGARTGLLGLVVLTSAINPWLGALLSLVVIVVAYFVAGWAFRLTVFGTVFCWDFLTVRRARFAPAENDNRMFAGANLAGVPVRSYGRLVQRTQGGLEFVYRPWLVRAPRVAQVTAAPATLAVGRGLFFSTVTADGVGTLFLLPPRYRGHEEIVARAYLMGGGVRPAGLRKAWGAIGELFGGAAAKTQLA
ncbi:MAG TPA: hypothetical protein VHD62_16625 [Opitutaceae bacterium]|nr:hypothetical protein [Opitutaceae bacterium]